MYGYTTTVNSGAAAEIHKTGAGIIKHSKLEPNSHFFNQHSRPTQAAKLQFLLDVDVYMRELSQSTTTTALSKLPVQWIDNSLQIQIKETRDKQKLLTNRIEELQKTVEEIRKTPQRKRDESEKKEIEQKKEREKQRERKAERRKRWEHSRTQCWESDNRAQNRDRYRRDNWTRSHREEPIKEQNLPAKENWNLFQQFQEFQKFQQFTQSAA